MLPDECVSFIAEHCGGVPLHLTQMVQALVESNLLFLTESPSGEAHYELEGDLQQLNLPTNLRDSIRMRLAASWVGKHKHTVLKIVFICGF